MSKEPMLGKLADAVLDGNEELTKQLVKDALEQGLTPSEIINGMSPGAREAGKRFSSGEYFLPELMMAGEAMNAGVQFLIPLMASQQNAESRGKIVIGSVEGDVHDIGKNIVTAQLRADGFEVVDLGIDVAPEKFIETVKKEKPDILALGSYMSTTLKSIEITMEKLVEASLRDSVKVIMGGVAVFPSYVEKIGGDGYGQDAEGAVQVARKLVGGE